MDGADHIVDELKKKLRAGSDAELARKLTVDKRTVSAWRARGAVPARYRQILDGNIGHASIATPPLNWGERERAAFELSLYRIFRAVAPEFGKDDFQRQYKIVHQIFPSIWFLMRDAQKDLSDYLEANGVPATAAVALLIHQDQIEEGVDKTRDRLRELNVPIA